MGKEIVAYRKMLQITKNTNCWLLAEDTKLVTEELNLVNEENKCWLRKLNCWLRKFLKLQTEEGKLVYEEQIKVKKLSGKNKLLTAP